MNSLILSADRATSYNVAMLACLSWALVVAILASAPSQFSIYFALGRSARMAAFSWPALSDSGPAILLQGKIR